MLFFVIYHKQTNKITCLVKIYFFSNFSHKFRFIRKVIFIETNIIFNYLYISFSSKNFTYPRFLYFFKFYFFATLTMITQLLPCHFIEKKLNLIFFFKLNESYFLNKQKLLNTSCEHIFYNFFLLSIEFFIQIFNFHL